MSDSCVELVTFDQLLRRYPQLEQHRIAPTGGAFCRAERLKGGGAAGTYAMPRPMAPTGDKHFFGFYLTDRRLLLADEPTGNLDSENSDNIIDLLLRLAHEENRCVIVVTHDLTVMDRADVVYRISDGLLQRRQKEK